MTQEHPITPPPHLIEQWMQDHSTKYALARKAAQWGADQELEACCEWVKTKHWIEPEFAGELRSERRPKPPSFKEQALLVLDEANLDAAQHIILLRALEQLDD